MPAPFPQPLEGEPVKSHPTGFPAFFDRRKPRIVTADPWAFFRHLARDFPLRPDRSRALAFIEQAFDFFEAAENPQIGSKPVLYYYSFLNLVKAALLVRRVQIPSDVHHGISDPRANVRTRLRLTGQRIKIPAAASNRGALFPEFITMLGGDASKGREIAVTTLLAQIACIHRTYTRVSGRPASFIPVRRCELLRGAGTLWARLVFGRHDKDVGSSLSTLRRKQAFTRVLRQKMAPENGELWFETEPTVGKGRGVDAAIGRLMASLQSLHLSTILTAQGYRLYICTTEPRYWLPPLAAGYAALFYLGSVTRYKPDVFDKILSGGYSWVVGEFLATYPLQFIYGLASELAGVDVVRPYATVT